MNVEELKQQILKTVQYHAIEEEIARVCYELAIQFAKQEVEKAFDAGYLKVIQMVQILKNLQIIPLKKNT